MTDLPDLEAIRRRLAAVPKGPWGFRGEASRSIELRTLHSGGIRLISTMMPDPCFVTVNGGDAQLGETPCDNCRTNYEQQDDDEFDWADAAPCTNPRAYDTLWLWSSDDGNLGNPFGHIQPANDWAVKERPYRDDVARVEHPIAEFVERSVTDIADLLHHVDRLTLQLGTMTMVHDNVQFDTPEDTAVQRKAVDQALAVLGWDRQQLAGHAERLAAARSEVS